MMKRLVSLLFVICFSFSLARAQSAEVTMQLNEQFFDVLLEALFRDSNPPEFPLSRNDTDTNTPTAETSFGGFSSFSITDFIAKISPPPTENRYCRETIRLQRQIDGVNTAVRFREGKIYAPIAFSGNYNPPLVGCVDFSGVAETNIELEFDKTKQALVGRAKVLNVKLSGTGGLASGLLARMVQSSIDKKINPINILQMEKVSFTVPIQNAGSIQMKAVGIRHEVINGALQVHIAYEFQKS